MIISLILVTLARTNSPFRKVSFKGIEPGYYSFDYELLDYKGKRALFRLAEKKTNAFILNDGAGGFDDGETSHDPATKPNDLSFYEGGITIEFVSFQLVSLTIGTFSNMEGAAHPNHYLTTKTFGYFRGKPKELALTDLFKKNTDSWKVVTKYAMEHVSSDADEQIQVDPETHYLKDVEGFSIKPGHLLLDVQPFNQPGAEVAIPFSAIRKYLDPRGPLASLLRK